MSQTENLQTLPGVIGVSLDAGVQIRKDNQNDSHLINPELRGDEYINVGKVTDVLRTLV
jgi:hypothetical protein